MYYKLNSNELMKKFSQSSNQADVLLAALDSIRAILYLLEAMEVAINEEIYSTISDDGKKYFKEIK